MHQATNREMSHQKAIELLPAQIRCLAPKNHLGSSQMRLEFIKCRLDFPPLMIKCSQFLRRSFRRIQNRGYESIQRLRIRNSNKSILNDTHLDSDTMTAILGGLEYHAKVGTVRQAFQHRQIQILFHTPQQVSPGGTARIPEVISKKASISHAKHPRPQVLYHLDRQLPFTRSVRTHLRAKQYVRPVLHKRNITHLRKATYASLGRRTAKFLGVHAFVRHVHATPINADQ
ncbi:hypothetical protein SAMN06295888_1693, partial [Desulfonatronum zhilinae]